jgi:hypothetical protein
MNEWIRGTAWKFAIMQISKCIDFECNLGICNPIHEWALAWTKFITKSISSSAQYVTLQKYFTSKF